MNATLLLTLPILLGVSKPLFDSHHLETIETPLLLNFTSGEGVRSLSLSKGTCPQLKFPVSLEPIKLKRACLRW